MAKIVSRNLYYMFKGIMNGLLANDINPDTDKYAQKAAEKIELSETPNFKKSKEKGVQDYSKTIPEEGRVVVKARVDARVNEEEAIRIYNEKAKEKAKQNEGLQKDRGIE